MARRNIDFLKISASPFGNVVTFQFRLVARVQINKNLKLEGLSRIVLDSAGQANNF